MSLSPKLSGNAAGNGFLQLSPVHASDAAEEIQVDDRSWIVVDYLDPSDELALAAPPLEAHDRDGPCTNALQASASYPPNSIRCKIRQSCRQFLRHVVDDFTRADDDMKDAFKPLSTASSQPRLRGIVAGAVGAVVAARLVPIRLSTLAAASVSAVAGTAEGSAEAIAQDVDALVLDAAVARHEVANSSPVLAEDASDLGAQRSQADFDVLRAAKKDFSALHDNLRDSIAGVQSPGASHEVSHFVGQVQQDFCQVHDEMQDALRSIVGAGKAFCGVSPTEGTCVFSAVAGSVAGALVATTLAPFRGVRLAVASASRPEPGLQERVRDTEAVEWESCTDTDEFEFAASESPLSTM